MPRQVFEAVSLTLVLPAIATLVAFILLLFIFRSFFPRIAGKLAEKTKIKLDKAALSTIKKSGSVTIIIAGLYLSVMLLPLATAVQFYLSIGLSIALVLLAIYIINSLTNALIRWYIQHVRGRKKEVGLATRLLEPFRVIMLIFALFVAVWAALWLAGVDALTITGWMIEHGWKIILIVILSLLAIIAIGELVSRLVVKSLTRRGEESEEEVGKRGNTLSKVLTESAQVFVLLAAVFTVLSEFNINIAPILAGAGVVGIAIGFGAQSMIRDIIAGVFIIMENQYRVGDVVRIADIAGLVEQINLRRTMLRDLDGTVHVVPNGEIRVASNFTKEWSRVNLNVSVAYGEDLDRVISVINRVGKELAEDPKWAPLIITPPSVLRVDNLGDSGIDIKILGDTKPIRQWDVMGELRKRLKKTFDEEGIEIPWPHTKVYFGNPRNYSGGDQSPPENKSK